MKKWKQINRRQVIERVDFPNKGIIRTEDGRQVIVKKYDTGTESVCFHQ